MNTIKTNRNIPSAAISGFRIQNSEFRTALTLVELMIAVVVMVLMMMAFGMIVTEAQKVVSITQGQTRGNNTADAIARTIRNDLSKITKNGFLCITQASSVGSGPRLFFANAGIERSRVGNDIGLGGISSYGTANGNLFHQGWILSQSGSGLRDVWNADLAYIQTRRRYEINQLIGNYTSSGPEANTLLDYCTVNLVFQVPPTTFAEAEDLWQLLSENVTRLGIMWTDGNVGTLTAGELDWYGVDRHDNVSGNIKITPKTVTTFGDLDDWETDAGTTPDDQDTFLAGPAGQGYKEFQAQSSTGNSYRALWTHHNQNNWPRAIRVRFTIRDEELLKASGEAATVYEVIVPID